MGEARLVLTKRRVSKLFLILAADVPTCVGLEIFLSIGIVRPPHKANFESLSADLVCDLL